MTTFGTSRRLFALAACLALVFGFAAPTADACLRCSIGLCINAASDGWSSCQEVVIIIGFPPTYTCNLSGNCEFEGGGGGEQGCEGVPHCGPFDPFP